MFLSVQLGPRGERTDSASYFHGIAFSDRYFRDAALVGKSDYLIRQVFRRTVFDSALTARISAYLRERGDPDLFARDGIPISGPSFTGEKTITLHPELDGVIHFSTFAIEQLQPRPFQPHPMMTFGGSVRRCTSLRVAGGPSSASTRGHRQRRLTFVRATGSSG